MADKALDEAAWKAYSGKHDIKDSALQKALAQLGRAEKQGPADVAEALDAVDKQIAALAKERKADKDVGKQLDEMRKAAEARRKEAAKELKEQQEQADADDEGDSPVLLTSKMVPLLRELRKGEARMHALVGTAGKNTAVLIMRRAIAPARRKLLAEALDAKGGAKYIPGEVLFEEGALTFVVKTQAAGLAKRVKAALLEQTEMRLKVRVRGEDPQDVDEDGEDGEDNGDARSDRDRGDGAGDKAGAQQAAPPPSPAALAHAQRLRVLQPRLDQALRDQHPEASRLRAVSGFASEKAAAGDHAAAGKALDSLEKLLDTALPGTTTGGVPPAPPAPPTRPTDEGAAVKARMTTLIPRLKEAAAAGVAGAQEAKLKLSEAGVLAGKREFARAAVLLDEAERLLAGAPGGSDGQGRQNPPGSPGEQAPSGSSRGEEAAREIEASRGKGHVRLKRLGIEWRQSLARSRSEADRLVLAVSNHPQVVHDPRADQIRAKAPELLKQLPRFDGSLESALQDLADAGDAAALQRSRDQALAAVQAYLKTLASNTMLRSMDDSFAGSVSIYAEMHGALDGMRQLLEQA